MDPDFHPHQPTKRARLKLDSLVEAPSKTPETFQTPDEVSAEQELETIDMTDPPSDKAKPLETQDWRQKLRRKLQLQWPPGRREWIIIAVLILLIGGGTAFALTRPSKPPVPVAKVAAAKPKAPPAPTTVASTLSGLPVAPSVNQMPVTAVMVENSTDARPQSGLSQAMVVFEAVAEGGVTRFMALYQDTSPDNVGPIRSARPYYIQWALGFDAGYAHVGGSPDGLADIKSWGVRDLDEFANGSYYHRITTREAPHNVYTAISTLNQLEDKKGYTSSTFTGFPRKKEAPAKQPTAATINLTLSGSIYNAQYSYVAASNSYNRSEGGAAQIDANNNQQISPKVVIAMVVPESQGALDASGAYYSDYNVIGSGQAYVFQDGTVTTGTWTKTDNTSQITFADATGKTIPLNPGQTWLTAVTGANDVSYTP
jgi:DUF3048 family protein